MGLAFKKKKKLMGLQLSTKRSTSKLNYIDISLLNVPFHFFLDNNNKQKKHNFNLHDWLQELT